MARIDVDFFRETEVQVQRRRDRVTISPALQLPALALTVRGDIQLAARADRPSPLAETGGGAALLSRR